MRFLVTGATGFIGSHLARLLVARGHDVRVLRRQESDLRALDGVKVSYATGDITEPSSLAGIFEGVDGLFHVAGLVAGGRRRAAEMHRVNVLGTRHILAAAREQGVRRAVVTSSIAALGDTDHPYHQSKRDCEKECWTAWTAGLEVVVVNPSVVLGPEEWTKKAQPLVQMASRRLLRVYPPGGTNVVDVRDVAAGHLAAFEKGRPGARYVLGGDNVTFRALLDAVCDAVGAPRPAVPVPGALLRVGASVGQMLDRVLPLPMAPALLDTLGQEHYHSSEPAEKELGYTHRAMRETVVDMVGWYRSAALA